MMFLPLLLAASLSVGNAEFDASTRSGALQIVQEREHARLKSEGPTKGVLKAKMLADPSRYETVEKARQTAESDYIRALAEEYSAAVGKAANELGVCLCTDGCFQYGSDDDRRLFESRFAEERKDACEEQAKTIVANVKPAEADFGRKDEAAIRTELEGAVIGRQRVVVFEENKKYISEKIVDPIMESARKELDRQREYLKRTRCDAYAPSVLARELAENLGRNVSERNSKNPENGISWGVFPIVVEQGAKEVAEKRTLERVAHAIDDVEMKVDTDLIRGKIAADREKHRKASDSEQVFRMDFAGSLAGKALDKVVADAPSAERDEFREFVMQRAGEASLGKAVEARVKRDLLPKLRGIRGEIAAEDAAKRWPSLVDGTWFPEPSVSDDICSRSDYSKAVKRWRDSSEIEIPSMCLEGMVFIEETDRLADEKVARAFDLARSAINAQNAVIDRVVPEVLAEVKNRKASWFRITPDLNKIIEMLTTGVESKWNETREEVLWGGEAKPSNAKEQHRELFPSVRERIELVAKAILDEMENFEETAERNPETTSEAEGLEFTISVKKSGGSVESKLLQGGKPLFEKTCPAEKGAFRVLSGSLTDKLIEVLEIK